ncbi:DUF1329 domain-containing protein [Tahibacter amnicola]|uniref:DUF1329 domain-containing protein n=1 Tax=Tahibacter amnicola TaxID=2976241 RepID=A0ABY6BBW5_9GAMM|nr:DUF1329 domain-containing protein [Tahibacter amnicola]UXI67534.1 DUF1329 domain-containing protein [Tahibacter amnicola]
MSFSIDANNVARFADSLSPGQVALLKKHPTLKLNVYPTRRSAAFPARTYEMTKKNAMSANLADGSDILTDAAEGFPFPLPKTGQEVMWNHKLKYRGIAVSRWWNQAAPTPSGQFVLARVREEFLFPYFRQGATLASIGNVFSYYFQSVESPARLAGNMQVIHETLNPTVAPRDVWLYNAGQRRVRRAPNVAYDNPGTASEGLRTNDMLDMFNGALDLYDWKLVGKKEMYVPYNAYRLDSGDLKPEDLVRPGHLETKQLRYELHRVWVVEATIKAGKRHIHPRRTFYLDEDSWQILLTDHYDTKGKLWRLSEAHTINYYEVPMVSPTLEVHYDLLSGRYLVSGLDNQEEQMNFALQRTPTDFAPNALRTRGIQ